MTLHKIAVRSYKQPFGGKNFKKRGLISHIYLKCIKTCIPLPHRTEKSIEAAGGRKTSPETTHFQYRYEFEAQFQANL